jgi:hypothetical protein
MVDMFAVQLDKMTDVYVDWSLAMADKGLGRSYTQPEDSVEEDQHPVWVVDLFGESLRLLRSFRSAHSCHLLWIL